MVISADPGRGTVVRRGSDVTLVVSKGPERYEVPPVVGMTVAEATARIQEVNLKVGKVTKAYDEKVPEGQVVSAKPGPGASLKKSTAVALTVSKGRQPIDVPDLTGKDATRAAPPAERPRAQGRRDQAAEQRHRRQGQGHQPEPARRHRCSAATP